MSHSQEHFVYWSSLMLWILLILMLQFNTQFWCWYLISYTLIYNNISTQITFFWSVITSLVDMHFRFESKSCFHFQGLRLFLSYIVPVVSPGTLATICHTVPYHVPETVFFIFTCLRSTNSKSLLLLSVSGLNIYPNYIDHLAYRIQDYLTANINIIQLDLWMYRKGKILMF